ncbi:globin domain-containing protein, partial [Providencia heimbachae]|uniref:globin domain-containing protein n=1 Tax=Providencia heimbachae TaxID=333962 RepID=UPI0022401171
MPTHTFIEILYKIYEILGLFKTNTNRRDLRNHSNFSSHQIFFTKALDEIIDTIDNQENIDKKIR